MITSFSPSFTSRFTSFNTCRSPKYLFTFSSLIIMLSLDFSIALSLTLHLLTNKGVSGQSDQKTPLFSHSHVSLFFLWHTVYMDTIFSSMGILFIIHENNHLDLVFFYKILFSYWHDSCSHSTLEKSLLLIITPVFMISFGPEKFPVAYYHTSFQPLQITRVHTETRKADFMNSV